ncbi:hypothetical protein HGM15179_018131 [Zosterops borbonicus]|uniref:Uncharacterized protein n=1 Tax=Zosterops borbonicus TaxID=364589 RepID=A0A8K1FZK7_9PASS|nr:hypothetical protein HGM15179_018131 [Zosterops borbonicus]
MMTAMLALEDSLVLDLWVDAFQHRKVNIPRADFEALYLWGKGLGFFPTAEQVMLKDCWQSAGDDLFDSLLSGDKMVARVVLSWKKFITLLQSSGENSNSDILTEEEVSECGSEAGAESDLDSALVDLSGRSWKIMKLAQPNWLN